MWGGCDPTKVGSRAGLGYANGLEMFYSSMQRGQDRLRSVFNSQPLQYDADMALYRRFGNPKRKGYLFVALALRHKRKHLALATAQIRPGRPRGQALRNRRRKITAAYVHAAKCFHKRFV